MGLLDGLFRGAASLAPVPVARQARSQEVLEGGGASPGLASLYGTDTGSAPSDMLGLYSRIVSIYRCVTIIARTVSSATVRVYNDLGDGEREEQDRSSPTVRLLHAPNTRMTGRRWLFLSVCDLELTGDSYSEIARRRSGGPAEQLWRMQRDYVEEKQGTPKPFRFGAGYGQETWFDSEDVLHVQYPDPRVSGILRGISPVTPSLRTLAADEALERAVQAILRNGVRLSGVLLVDKDYGPDKVAILQKQMGERASGVDKWGKHLVVPGGQKWESEQLTMEELQALATRSFNLDQILYAWGVPKFVFGVTDLSATRENATTQRKHFMESNVLPKGLDWSDDLTHFLLPKLNGKAKLGAYGDTSRQYVELDYSDAPVMRELAVEEARANSALTTQGVLTINEVRAPLGYEPVPWGDAWWGPFGVAPLARLDKGDESMIVAFASTLAEALRIGADGPHRKGVRVPARVGKVSADVVIEAGKLSLDDAELAAMESIFEDILLRNGKRALADIDVAAEFGKDTPGLREWLRRKIIQFADATWDTCSEVLRETLDEGLAAGENMGELAARVSEAFDGRRSQAEVMLVARTECLPAETLVEGAVVEAVHRRWYDGPMVTIRTEGGSKLSATPNHPMLTTRGWVGAGGLREGDCLVCDGRYEHPGAAGHVDVEAGPPTLGQVFDAVKAVGVLERRRTGQPDFHGDGMDGEVDILRPDGVLRIGDFAPLNEPVVKDLLSEPNQARARFCAQCSGLLTVDEKPCFCTRAPAAREGEASCLAEGAQHAGLPQDGGQPLPVRPEARREFLEGSSGGVERHGLGGYGLRVSGPPCLDRVVSIEVRSWSGHVFNLSTVHGYYTINGGAYTGNTVGTANAGAMLAYQEAGIKEHAWVSARDSSVRPSHAAIDGEVVPIGARFSIGLKFPGDTDAGDPGEFVNCRCSLEGVIPGVKRADDERTRRWKSYAEQLDRDEQRVAKQQLRILRVQEQRVLAVLRGKS